MPFDEDRLKEIIKEGVKEATEEKNEVIEQELFIGKAQAKYYKSYTDLAEIVKQTQGKFNITVDNRKLNLDEKNIVLRSKKKFQGMLKDELVERRLKAKKIKEKEERRLKNFKREMKIDQIKKTKRIEKVVMNEKKRVSNIKAIEEKNEIKLKKLAEKHEKLRQVDRRKKELEVEREVKDKNVTSVQALTKHYHNQIELIKNQLGDLKFENYIAETAQKGQISQMKQEIRDRYKNVTTAY
jgi:uncharacterized protein (DUF3084 family)